MAAPANNFSAELARIQQAYTRRRAHIPADRYSCFSPAHVLMIQELERSLLQDLRKHGYTNLQDRSILDVGCGTGFWLRNFVSWGASPEKLSGIDLLGERVEQARRLLPRDIT